MERQNRGSPGFEPRGSGRFVVRKWLCVESVSWRNGQLVGAEEEPDSESVVARLG